MFNADCFLGFQHIFKAPVVAFRTGSLSTWAVDRTGNPDNPSYIPSTLSGFKSHMSFLDRLYNLLEGISYKIAYKIYSIECTEIARKHFGEDMPDLEDLARNTSLYLVNTHFVHQLAKPIVPNVKEVAGLHVKEVKPLPEVT